MLLVILPLGRETTKSVVISVMGSDVLADFISCTRINEESVSCNGSVYNLAEKRLTYHDKDFWIYVGIYTGLVLIAGLMSGLTMGLLSLDTTTLTVLRDGGTDKERKYAKRILPLVSRHHLLLVTLLLANAVAVEAMPIFLDRVSDPIIAIVVSVTAVLLFGEVIPQAVCTRHGLAIGAVLSPFVYVLMGFLFIIAWPLSKLLDCILGEGHGTFYRRGQLKVLVDMHGPGRGHRNGEHDKDELTIDEVLIIKGALDMKFKTAGTAMIPISDVYMVSLEAKLDHETMTHIITRGHSRIPVYAKDRSNVIGLLLTKTLIKLNPADATPVTQVLQSSNYARPAMFIDEDMPLFDLLNLFQTGKNHLAMVRKKTSLLLSGASGNSAHRHDDTKPLLTIEDESYEDDTSEIVGIITLEDVIEELLQEEINDELDMQTMMEMSGLLQVAMAKAVNSHKNQLHRCKSQPQCTQRLSEPDTKVRQQLSSSLGCDLDPPLVTFI